VISPEKVKPADRVSIAPLPSWAGSAPDWQAAPPPPEPPRAESLAPSRPEGVEYGPVPASASPLAHRDALGRRFLRGRLIHGLLQHLPALPPERWAQAARTQLDRPGHGLEPEAVATVVEQTLAILRHPELTALFGPGSRAEAPLAGTVGGAVVGGVVDRLAVLPDRVLVADFKTNREPPADLEATPALYLRQMAAYQAVLSGIFRDRPIQCALVWTETAQVQILPAAVLQTYEPGSPLKRRADLA
jgi:ATP-dependent helicase/nuclease subunit A